jgi:hypothetical protein
MSRVEKKRFNEARRDFIKTMTLAGVAATLPGGTFADVSHEGETRSKRRTSGKKNLLCLSDNPQAHDKFIELIRTIPKADLTVSPVKVNYQNPEEIVQVIHDKNMDILLLILPKMTFSFGKLCDAMGDLDIPVIVLTINPELIPIDANLASSLRGNGADITFAISEEQALERIRTAALPMLLEGQRAVLYSKPFNSTTVTSHNLNEDIIYNRTGVDIKFRPIEELAEQYKKVEDKDALKEMERWKREAKEVAGVPDKAIIDACRLYVLLRSIVDKEGLSAVSIDCLGFTLSPNPVLPYPCLAFSRLRDEGITAACEADVVGMLSSMFMEQMSRKPSFMCNLMSVNPPGSKISVSHCVAPLKLSGFDAPQMQYRLHSYHGFGKGAVPEVEFPINGQVLIGGFSKDLKTFTLWPGQIESQVKDTETAKAKSGPINTACANTMDVKIRDATRFIQNIPGLHQIMVLANYTGAMEDALTGMNVKIAGPTDFTPFTA